ncbi:MAG: FtsX-like permease family protein [Bacteroidia bacterium]|nr:FtsX-like permease family protein [Bacteroidia bacterium]
MSPSFKIATRYFFSRKWQGGFNAISLISYISLLGYAVGAAALLIVLSVFNGFEGLFTQLYTHFDADLKLTPASGKYIMVDDLPVNKIKAISGIKGYTHIWEENALLRYNGKQTIATVKGVDKNYLELNTLDSNLRYGELILSLGNDTSFALVGNGIAYQLGVDPGDQFNYLGVYLPKKGKVDMLNPDDAFAHGLIFPAGVFSIQEEVDNKYVLVPISYIFKLIEDSSRISALEIKLEPKADKELVRTELKKLLGEKYQIRDRFEQRESFFKVMQSEKTISYFILVFILLIAAFNTIGSLYMLVIEKRKDIEVLASMGLKSGSAALIFVYQSLYIAISGGLIGVVVGLLVCYGQQHFEWVALQTSGNTMISAYPILVKFTDAVQVFFTLLFMGFVTSLYPAYKAASLAKQA